MPKPPLEEARPQPPEPTQQLSIKPEITLLLRRWQQGDQDAFEQLFQATYDELRREARRLLYAARQQEAIHTVSLVNEMFMRLAKVDDLKDEGRAIFFKYAIETMRHLIIDSVRKRQRSIRGGGAEHLPLEEIANVSEKRCRQLIALDDALKDLKYYRPEYVVIIEMHYFGGLTNIEIAEMTGKSEATIKRHKQLALQWLKSYMEGDCHESKPN